MAEGGPTDSLDYILECPICNEDFTLEGGNIPRILPCSHSLCELCIEGILRQNPEGCNLLQCPECKKKHPAPKRAKSFTQNKFILPIIRRKHEERRDDVQMCKKHGREINIFCNDVDCQKAICNLCMFESHREHNFVDLLQLKAKKSIITVAKTESMKGKIESLIKDLESNKEKLLVKRQELYANRQACKTEIERLKKAKIVEVTEIISQMYDDMTWNLETQTENDLRSIERDIGIIEGHTAEAERIKEQGATQTRLKFILYELQRHSVDRHYIKLSCKINPADRKAIGTSCDKMVGMDLGLNLLETLDMHVLATALPISGKGTSKPSGLRQSSSVLLMSLVSLVTVISIVNDVVKGVFLQWHRTFIEFIHFGQM